MNGPSSRHSTTRTGAGEYEKATAEGGIMVFIRDSKKRVLRSSVFTLDDTATAAGAP
jgi:hypothetical protein